MLPSFLASHQVRFESTEVLDNARGWRGVRPQFQTLEGNKQGLTDTLCCSYSSQHCTTTVKVDND